jgi:uncharacterized membrane protein
MRADDRHFHHRPACRAEPEFERTAVPSHPSVAAKAKRNIEEIVRLEQQLVARQSRTERWGRGVASFFGSFRFVVAQFLFIVTWITVNTERPDGLGPFDPYPFPFLSLIVGMEFIFLTTFVLINQKHEMRRTEQWSHLHLQLSMLTEQEVTTNLKMLQTICQTLKVEMSTRDPEVSELSQNTEIAALAGEIEKARDNDVSP